MLASIECLLVLVLRFLAFEIHTEALTSLSRMPGQGNKKTEGSAFPLNSEQVALLAEGSSDDRLAMAWLAVLKRIQLTEELTRDLLRDKLEGSDALLSRSDMTGFYEAS